MFDWVPLESYSNLYYYILLVVMIFVIVNAFSFDVRDQKSISIISIVGWFVTIFIMFYMGFRPINGVFIDMMVYANSFYKFQRGATVKIEKDYVFNYFMKWCSTFMSAKNFFFFLATLYIVPCIIFSKKYLRQYWFFAVLMFLSSFSFWAYGVNGMRNGLATALFILGLCFYQKKYLIYPIFLLAYFMHASMIIPTFAFFVTGFYKNPKIYIFIWILAIPMSLLGGDVWMSFFSNLGIAEDRATGYLVDNVKNMSKFSSTGFRWDFVLYSVTAIFAGYYFIYKKKIVDDFYVHLFGIYCIANAFWILVISAAFSNRFAYLSWFLMPVIFAYPMFRYKIWNDQYKVFGIILFMYFMFTFLMNVKF